MSSNNSLPPTLFSIGNRYFREGRLQDALAIYELLTEVEPSFLPYAQNEEAVRNLIGLTAGKTQAKKKFHLGKSTEYQKRLRIADIISREFKPELIDLCFPKDAGAGDSQHLLAKANASRPVPEQWLSSVNQYLKKHKINNVALGGGNGPEGRSLFLNLKAKKLPEVEGPLVTICMSCFNAGPYVEHAIRSLLGQSYKNIELYAIDDQSEDDTYAVLKRLKAVDSRLKIGQNKVNQGTYITRNDVFSKAKGEFFTIMDADDFALPERIALQVAELQSRPKLVGVMTEWLRMAADGEMHFKMGWGGTYQHEAVATLMLRTKQAKKDVGYWDSVRFAADTEYMNRLIQFYGSSAVELMKIPTVLSLYHEESLTNHPVTGIGVGGVPGLSPVRVAYRDSWMAWHKKAGKQLFLNYPQVSRLFEAPPEMLVV